MQPFRLSSNLSFHTLKISIYHLLLHSTIHPLLNFKLAVASTIHMNNMDNNEYTNNSNSTKAQMKRKHIMQEKRHTHAQFSVHTTLQPAPQNAKDNGKKLYMPFRMISKLTLPKYNLENFGPFIGIFVIQI